MLTKIAALILFVAGISFLAGNAASDAISDAADTRDRQIEEAIGL